MTPVFNQALKAGHVGFVTDTNIQCISRSLKSLTNVLAENSLDDFFNNGVCNKRSTFGISTKLARIWGKRFAAKHCLTDCDTTNVPMC